MPGSFLHPFTQPRQDQFMTIRSGKGALVWDDAGNEYIDAMASLWYVNIGHGREEMADAIATQAKTLAAYQTFHPFTTEPTDQAASTIAELSPLVYALAPQIALLYSRYSSHFQLKRHQVC